MNGERRMHEEEAVEHPDAPRGRSASGGGGTGRLPISDRLRWIPLEDLVRATQLRTNLDIR